LLSQAGGESQLPQALARVEIQSFGETSLNMVRPSAVEKGLALRLEIDDDVPSVFFVDAQKLRQALANLLGNAVKFTEEGHVTLRISRAPMGLRFSVIDTGIGIPESKRDLLFQRFSRIEGPHDTVEGTGLGLSITKALIERMDGAIGVERHVGRGATFWFDLPLRLAPPAGAREATAPRTLAPRPAVQAPPSQQKRRILLADDLDLNRRLIADMLGLDGHLVDCVGTGVEAVNAVKRQLYDLILMDVIMPDMDGLAATRAIRALPAPFCDIPIVALTAHSFEDQLDTCLEAGMNATLVKPMSMEDLSTAVTAWTRDREQAA
jgi:CheY-like chemotaxis protein